MDWYYGLHVSCPNLHVEAVNHNVVMVVGGGGIGR